MELSAFLQTEHIPYEENISLRKRTWIHRGGNARYYIVPETIEQLRELVTYLYKEQIEFKLVGHTSNLYIRNTTDIDIVISTIHLNHYEEIEGKYICECGVAVAGLSAKAIEHGYAGYEGLVNLPGTVASAVVNNASCFKCSISDLLVEAEVLCPDRGIRKYTKDMFVYRERSSAFKRGEEKGILLRVTLDCSRKEAKEKLLAKAKAHTEYRKTRQEGPKQNLGSTYPTYVMRAFSKNLPAYARILLSMTSKLDKITGKKHSRKWIYSLILLCNGKYNQLHRYISKYNFGCFVWRDEQADEAFDVYRSFVAKVSGMPDIEIEVL